MIRASLVVNCQSMGAGRIVAMGLPGVDFLSEDFEAGDPAIQALAGQGAEFDLGDIKPATVLRGVVELDSFGQATGLGCGKGFVERGGGVSVEVVEDESDFDRLGVTFLQHGADEERPIPPSPVFACRHVTPPGQRLHFEKDFGHAVADIFVVDATGTTGCHRQGRGDFVHELLAGLVHAHQREALVVREVVSLKDILHAGDKGAVLLGRNLPVLAYVRLQLVFFSVRWMVMVETAGAILSSTTFSAKSRTVQRP